jgi:nitroreductase
MSTEHHPDSEAQCQLVYERLSAVLELLLDFELTCSRTEDRVAITILEEDITALLEECEDLFLLPNTHGQRRPYRAFVSRGETILEEAEKLLGELSALQQRMIAQMSQLPPMFSANASSQRARS